MTKSKPTSLSCFLHSTTEVADWSSNPSKIERAWSRLCAGLWIGAISPDALTSTAAGSLSQGALKTYKGFPHGMPTTEAATINADLLAFITG